MPKGVYPRTEEHRRILSLIGKGRKLSEEHKKKIGLALRGRTNAFKGKTYEEIYGVEEAEVQRVKRHLGATTNWRIREEEN